MSIEQFFSVVNTNVMYVILAGIVIGIGIWIYNLQKDANNTIDIADIICDNGRLDGSKLFRLIAFIVSSWAFCFLVLNDKLTDTFYLTYIGIWTGNALLRNRFNMNDAFVKDETKP